MKIKKIKRNIYFLMLIIIGVLMILFYSNKEQSNSEQTITQSKKIVVSSQTKSNLEQNINIEPHVDETTGAKYVTYEDFGAKAEEGYDDYNVIKETHAFANENNYEVRATEGKTYHIYRWDGTETINIQTNTNWNNSNIIIHDEDINDKATREYPIFRITSNMKDITISDSTILENIKINKQTTKIDKLSGYGNCLCIVYNSNKKQYIRSGGNLNSGASQEDLFEIDNEGNVLNEIQWDFEQITYIQLIKIPEETIRVENANFTTILADSNYEQESGYFNRNIICSRSNTVIENINHNVNNDEYIGGPYFGFIRLSYVSDVILKNSTLYSHRYETKSNYDLILEHSANITICNVTSNDIENINRWGITGTNYTKDITYENCELNRIDAHTGVHNLTINNCTIGIKGLTLTGSGDLNLNDVTRVGGSYFVELRADYGSTWNGDINIEDCTFEETPSDRLIYFRTTYEENGIPHDYGYDLYLPNVYIDGLNIKDKAISNNYDNIYIFYNGNSETGTENGDMRNNYNLPQNIIIKNYQTASGRKIKLFNNKFYNNLDELGINLSIPLIDKEEVSIATTTEQKVENNLYTNVDVRIIRNDVEGIETIVKVNGNVIGEDETFSKEENYVVEVTYQNSVGEIELENTSFTIDKTAPKIIGVENGSKYYRAVILNSTDTDIDEINLYKDDKEIEYILGKEILEIGNYTIKISDYAGNIDAIKFEIAQEFTNNDNYEISSNFILGILSNTSLEEFNKKLDSDVKYDIYRNNKKLDKNQIIATGDILVTENDNEYYLIVKGDGNKDGYSDITDLFMLKRYLLSMILFDEYSEKAIDLNTDEIVDITDLLLMRRLLLE